MWLIIHLLVFVINRNQLPIQKHKGYQNSSPRVVIFGDRMLFVSILKFVYELIMYKVTLATFVTKPISPWAHQCSIIDDSKVMDYKIILLRGEDRKCSSSSTCVSLLSVVTNCSSKSRWVIKTHHHMFSFMKAGCQL